MDRRSFFGMMVGGVALAAARSYPFRVFSFPKELGRPSNTRFLVPPHTLGEDFLQHLGLMEYQRALLFRNGLRLQQGFDYTLSGDGTLVFLTPPAHDDILEIINPTHTRVVRSLNTPLFS